MHSSGNNSSDLKMNSIVYDICPTVGENSLMLNIATKSIGIISFYLDYFNEWLQHAFPQQVMEIARSDFTTRNPGVVFVVDQIHEHITSIEEFFASFDNDTTITHKPTKKVLITTEVLHEMIDWNDKLIVLMVGIAECIFASRNKVIPRYFEVLKAYLATCDQIYKLISDVSNTIVMYNLSMKVITMNTAYMQDLVNTQEKYLIPIEDLRQLFQNSGIAAFSNPQTSRTYKKNVPRGLYTTSKIVTDNIELSRVITNTYVLPPLEIENAYDLHSRNYAETLKINYNAAELENVTAKARLLVVRSYYMTLLYKSFYMSGLSCIHADVKEGIVIDQKFLKNYMNTMVKLKSLIKSNFLFIDSILKVITSMALCFVRGYNYNAFILNTNKDDREYCRLAFTIHDNNC